MSRSVHVQPKSRIDLTVCPYCRDNVAGRLRQPCAGCETELHLACWRELSTCPTFGCDETPTLPVGIRVARRTQDEAERVARAAGHHRIRELRFGTEEWLEDWSRQEPAARAVELATWTFLWALPALALLFGVCGGVIAASYASSFFLGMLFGVLAAVPGAYAVGLYGALQGLVGIRTPTLRNGGVVTLVLAGALGILLAQTHIGLGIAAAVTTGLLSGRVFGFHVALGT